MKTYNGKYTNDDIDLLLNDLTETDWSYSGINDVLSEYSLEELKELSLCVYSYKFEAIGSDWSDPDDPILAQDLQDLEDEINDFIKNKRNIL